MKKKVLVITSSVDDTASYFIGKYSDVIDFFRWNINEFGHYQINITENGWVISTKDETISEKETQAIYYRKPILPDIQIYDHQYHTMIQRDIIATINGIADSFDNVVLTRPSILRKTENKIFQLEYAKKNGFSIPQSYIGNCGRETEKFESITSIIKPLTTGKTYGKNGCEIYQTNIFKECREDISLTPLYLQEYIPKKYEVRLTIVADKLFPVRIDTENKIDWRADYSNHRYSIIEVPIDIQRKCIKLMKDFEILFGAFDFIVTPSGEWVFLEINPNGQWQWLEQCLNINISESIMKLLSE